MWLPLLSLAALVSSARAHGRVLEPPSRASAWRFGFNTAPDYDDDGLNCGGFAMQWSVNGGRCGICGDPYQIPPPRPHELGGTYGQGVITGKYLSGSLFTTTVELTTSHKGFWEFKLCPDPENNEQACFDKHILELEDGGTKFYPTQGSKKYLVTYRLPKGMICDHCVLQWRYTAGNNWGDCKNGTQALGCGNQEQFGACSDITIGVTKTPLEKDQGTNEIPYPLFYYMKHGYFDTDQGNRHKPGPQQQLIIDDNHKKSQPHKKKPKPNQQIIFNQQHTNSHQKHITQKLKQPIHIKRQPDSQKKPFQPSSIYSPFDEYTKLFEKYTQPSLKNPQPSENYGQPYDKYPQRTEKYGQLYEKYPQPTEKYGQPYEKYPQLTEKYQQHYYQQKKKPSTTEVLWHTQPGFFDDHWKSGLQPAFFEVDHQNKTHQNLSQRKPRAKHKGPKKKPRRAKLFYGIWR